MNKLLFLLYLLLFKSVNQRIQEPNHFYIRNIKIPIIILKIQRKKILENSIEFLSSYSLILVSSVPFMFEEIKKSLQYSLEDF